MKKTCLLILAMLMALDVSSVASASDFLLSTSSVGTLLPGLDSLGTLSQSTVRATGTGTIPRTLQSMSSVQIDLISYGVKADGITDNSTFITNAMTDVQTALSAGKSVSVLLPMGNIVYGGGTVLDATVGNLSITGYGRGTSRLVVNNAANNGISIKTSANQNVTLQKFSLVRTANGAAQGIGLEVTSNVQQFEGQTTIDSIYVGPDNFNGNAGSWTTCIHTGSLAISHITNVKTFQQYVGQTDDGSSGLKIDGLPNQYAINTKITDSSFQGGWAGIRVGDWVQGVFIDNADIIGGTSSIQWIPDVNTGTEYLSLSNSHLNPSLYGINIANGDGLVSNTYILQFSQGPGFIGINYSNMGNFHVTGTMLRSTGGFSQGNKGIVGGGASQWGTMTGNSFDGFSICYELDGTAWETIVGGVYANNVTLFVDNAKNPLTKFLNASLSTDSSGALIDPAPNNIFTGSLLPSVSGGAQIGGQGQDWSGVFARTMAFTDTTGKAQATLGLDSQNRLYLPQILYAGGLQTGTTLLFPQATVGSTVYTPSLSTNSAGAVAVTGGTGLSVAGNTGTSSLTVAAATHMGMMSTHIADHLTLAGYGPLTGTSSVIAMTLDQAAESLVNNISTQLSTPWSSDLDITSHITCGDYKGSYWTGNLEGFYTSSGHASPYTLIKSQVTGTPITAGDGANWTPLFIVSSLSGAAGPELTLKTTGGDTNSVACTADLRINEDN